MLGINNRNVIFCTALRGFVFQSPCGLGKSISCNDGKISPGQLGAQLSHCCPSVGYKFPSLATLWPAVFTTHILNTSIQPMPLLQESGAHQNLHVSISVPTQPACLPHREARICQPPAYPIPPEQSLKDSALGVLELLIESAHTEVTYLEERS